MLNLRHPSLVSNNKPTEEQSTAYPNLTFVDHRDFTTFTDGGSSSVLPNNGRLVYDYLSDSPAGSSNLGRFYPLYNGYLNSN